MQGLVCQTSELEPSWVDSQIMTTISTLVWTAHQCVVSPLDFGNSLLTGLPILIFWAVLQPLLHLAIKAIFYCQTMSPIIFCIKSRCSTMACKFDHDLAPALHSDLISHSCIYSFCSSHTIFAVLGIYWAHSSPRAFFAVPSY